MINYINKIKQKLAKKITVENNLLNLYTLLVFTKGEDTTLEDVHNAWSINENDIFPEHWSLKPFKELNKDVQEKDKEYQQAIIEIAKEVEDE